MTLTTPPRITLNRLPGYPFKSVWEVTAANAVMGLIENAEGGIEWKAFIGSGFSCRYLKVCYSRDAAVQAILETANDTRKKNVNWTVCSDNPTSFDGAQLAVMMDIRDELQKLNRVFECYRFLEIPDTLRTIRRNTSKPRRKRKR